jgi:hypothetical protein
MFDTGVPTSSAGAGAQSANVDWRVKADGFQGAEIIGNLACVLSLRH